MPRATAESPEENRGAEEPGRWGESPADRPCRHGRSRRSAALRREPVSSLRRPYNEEDQGPCHRARARDLRVVYDHEDHVDAGAEPVPGDARDAVTVHEDSRGRRREIADWGGDELFGGRVARLRFPAPAPARRATRRRRTPAAPRPVTRASLERPLSRADERRGGPEPFEAELTDADRDAPTDDAASGRFRRPAPRAAGETPTDDVAAGRFRRRAPRARETRGRHARTLPRPGARPQRGRPRPDPRRRRRTVRIGSRPEAADDAMPAQPTRRRRPPRTVHERVGAQPRPSRDVGVRARPRAHPDRRRHGRRPGLSGVAGPARARPACRPHPETGADAG